MARKYLNPIRPRYYAPTRGGNKTSFRQMDPRQKAEWLRDGGGSWSLGELAAMAVGRSSEAYEYTFRFGTDTVPYAIREAAKIRLREMFAKNGYTKQEVRIRLDGYWSPQKIAAFLKNYRPVK